MNPNERKLYSIRWTQPYGHEQQRRALYNELESILQLVIDQELAAGNDYQQARTVIERIKQL